MIVDDHATAEETCCSIHVQGVYFYFDWKNRIAVLNDVSIVVPRGSIYSLLGPSGCGKTTLLKCLVGQYKPKVGSVKIFGRAPGSSGFAIPGRGVGYMPQELALYLEMTTKETLEYFGSLYNMSNESIKERIDFLVELLALADINRLIKNLSGGQQRRVSFAVALIHKPPLLILDEPTVGVDPMLRRSIWRHLIDLARNEQITIIITTHYIEEAAQADVVALLRDGRLLAEKNPGELMRQHGMNTLEEVFLKLCEDSQNEDGTTEPKCDDLTSVATDGLDYSTQNGTVWVKKEPEELHMDRKHHDCNGEVIILNGMNGTKKYGGNYIENGHGQDNMTTLLPPPYPKELDYPTGTAGFIESLMRILCLTKKNTLRLKRNRLVMLIEMLIPTIQTVIFCVCVGAYPHNLPLAIVNMEEDPAGFSHSFLQSLHNVTIHKKPYDNLTSAVQSVRDGETWAALHIGPDFSTCLLDRILENLDASNVTVDCSLIKVHMDSSNQLVAATLYTSLSQSFLTFATNLLTRFGRSPVVADPPLKVVEFIYGSPTSSPSEFMAPGSVLAITYIIAVGVTALAIILEKKQGLFDRTFIAGATKLEVLLSFFIALMFSLIVQNILVLVCLFAIFQVPCYGPLFWIVVSVFTVGISGMAYGFVISCLTNDEKSGLMIALGSFYPIILLSGVIWPVEGMPYFIRYFSYCLPLTKMTDSMRNIMLRGWGFTDYDVWHGYLICNGWTLAFMILAMLLFKYKQ